MTLGETIRSGTKWLFAGSVGRQLFQFVFGIVLARLLVPEDFGMLVTVQIFTGIAGYLASGGMGEALVQAKDVAPRDYRVVFTAQLSICILIYIFFFTIAPWFAAWFDEPLYQSLLRVSALSFLIRPFANIPNAKLRREMRFKQTAIVSVISMFVGSIASIIMAILGLGVWSLIFGGIIGSVISATALIAVSHWRPAFTVDMVVARRLGGYGIKFSINDIAIYMKSQSSNFIISHLMGPAMVGLFNKAYSLSDIPRQLILGSIYQPVFRGMAAAQEDIDLSKYMYFRTITLVTVYLMPVYVALWWIAEPFIYVIYGQKWMGSVEPLEILALSGLYVWAGQSGALIAAQNRLGREILITVETWLTLVLVVLVSIQWGINGVAWAIVVNGAYTSLRLFSLARQCVGGTYANLLSALRPGFILNAILFMVMFLADAFLLGGYREQHSMMYLACMCLLGFIVYALLFLYMPMAELSSESIRWKRKLGIPVLGKAM